MVLPESIEGSSFSSTNVYKYDVFLSFRGKDTRNTITDHLYKALVDSNISTFLDNEEIETGGDLKPELKSAIKESRASIIVLSKDYASSSWCLDELVMILEQRKTSNQIVIPIYYHVKPTHVRKQHNTFGVAIATHKKRMGAETDAAKRTQFAQKIERWTNALTQVADLKGMTAEGRPETEFIAEIVKWVYHRLRVPLRSTLPLLIGREDPIEFVTLWLKDDSSHRGDMLTILGMGGIGKTSLAKYVYGLRLHEFDRGSFIEDISRKCANIHGLLDLQKQLCDDIVNRSPDLFYDVSVYTSKIENALAKKKVFLVLDDIDSVGQLDTLLGSKGLHPGSKIIITTRYSRLIECCALFKTNAKPEHAEYELKGLCENESSELLCSHAFASNYPKAGYDEVIKKIVKHCHGHPLALQVLGSDLRNMDVVYWEEYIKGLRKESISIVLDRVLRKSFDYLHTVNDKELFKHIACFFVGIDRDVTETILNACGMGTRFGIINLIDRGLLSIGQNNELVMHQLFQGMGRFLVHQESPDKPWKRSRLCGHEESFKVLEHKKGKRNTVGLALDIRMLEKEKPGVSFELETDALSNMTELMILHLNYVQMNGPYENFPAELRWLRMHGFPEKSIPLELRMENLVALDLSYSKIESFDISYTNPSRPQKRQKLHGSCSKDKKFLGSLKILDLSFCDQLRRVGGFDGLHGLKRLILTNCIRLLEVCKSIEQCVKLVLVDLSYCKTLKILPRTINMLRSVETLLLDGCDLGESRINISDMESQKMLKANNIGINRKFFSSVVLEDIPSDWKFFTTSLPRCLVSLSCENTNLSNESFPMDFSCLSMLTELCLDENPIVSLPDCMRNLPSLVILSMKNCKMLISVENPPYKLAFLDLYSNSEHKPLLQKIVFVQEMSPLELSLGRNSLAPSSFEIEGMVKIQPMTSVNEKVLRGLGWTNLDFPDDRHVGTDLFLRGPEESEIQMYYEFGIFSTIYGGKKMPNWIRHGSKGPSISFTIPSSHNNLRGLNFCFVQTSPFSNDELHNLPLIKISTNKNTWIYEHYIQKVSVGGECVVLLSHWMFGRKEMKGGDKVTITVTEGSDKVTKECGVSFVYDDGKTGEEDALGYYKSWNHIIGGHLTGFQLTTGQYILHNERFLVHGTEVNLYYRPLVGDNTSFKDEVWFRAFSRRKSDIVCDLHEDQYKVGLLPSGDTPPPPTTGPPQSNPIVAPRSWFGRSLCSTDSTGRFFYVTLERGSRSVKCNFGAAAPPATMAEFTLNGVNRKDLY